MSRDEADDLEIASLCTEIEALLDMVAVLTSERDSYRELAQTAVHQLHDRTADLQHLRKAYYALLEQYRELRQLQAHRPAA